MFIDSQRTSFKTQGAINLIEQGLAQIDKLPRLSRMRLKMPCQATSSWQWHGEPVANDHY